MKRAHADNARLEAQSIVLNNQYSNKKNEQSEALKAYNIAAQAVIDYRPQP